MSTNALIADLATRGIEVRTREGKLVLDGPASALTDQLIADLRQRKAELLVALQADPVALDEDATEYFEERSAIGEYDGEISREEAENQAAKRVFEYQLADMPDSWLLLVCRPGDTVEDARECCIHQFGAERVVSVRQYHYRAEGRASA